MREDQMPNSEQCREERVKGKEKEKSRKYRNGGPNGIKLERNGLSEKVAHSIQKCGRE